MYSDIKWEWGAFRLRYVLSNRTFDQKKKSDHDEGFQKRVNPV